MKKIILVIITMLLLIIPFQQVVMAYNEKFIETMYITLKEKGERENTIQYLGRRAHLEGKPAELPNREELGENELVIYACAFDMSFGIGLKDVEEILDMNIGEYYFYDLETKWAYYEMNKQRPFKISDALYGSYQFARIYFEGYYAYNDLLGINDDVIKFIYDDDTIKGKINSELQIQDRYVFFNYDYMTGYHYWVYYKTNMGDYIYELTYKGEKYLYPVEEYKYYQKVIVEREKEYIRSVEMLPDGGAIDDEYDMCVFNVDSPDFNINAKASDIIGTIGNETGSWNYLYYIFGIVIIGGTIGMVFIFAQKMKQQ